MVGNVFGFRNGGVGSVERTVRKVFNFGERKCRKK